MTKEEFEIVMTVAKLMEEPGEYVETYFLHHNYHIKVDQMTLVLLDDCGDESQEPFFECARFAIPTQFDMHAVYRISKSIYAYLY